MAHNIIVEAINHTFKTKKLSKSQVRVDGVSEKQSTRSYTVNVVFDDSKFRSIVVQGIRETIKRWCGLQCANKMVVNRHLESF